MGELSISHFRELLSKNVECLQNFCKEWEEIYGDPSVPEEAKEEIRSTIGLTNLLMRQKLKQFQGLIDDSEFKLGNQEITCSDLQGFWDMVYNEVEKVTRSFQKLVNSKENNWSFADDHDPQVENKKEILPVLKRVLSTKKHASAARQRLAAAKLRMKEQMALKEDKNFDDPMDSKIKSPLSVVTNIHVSAPTEEGAESIPSKKVKSLGKLIVAQKKENLLSGLSLESKVSTAPSGSKKREKSKEIVLFQCVTRSAKKALLAKQNVLQN